MRRAEGLQIIASHAAELRAMGARSLSITAAPNVRELKPLLAALARA